MPNLIPVMPNRITTNVSKLHPVKVATLGLPELNVVFNMPGQTKLTELRPNPRALRRTNTVAHYVDTYIDREKTYWMLWERIRTTDELDPRFIAAVIMKIGLFKDFPLYLLRDSQLSENTQARFMHSTLEFQTVRSFINKFYLFSQRRITMVTGYAWEELAISITAPFGDETKEHILKCVKSIN